MRRVLLLTVVIVAACGGEPLGAGSSASVPAATPTTTASCRLPVWLYGWTGTANQGTGYFLEGSRLVPAQPPETSPDGVATYVATAKRWVHVNRPFVAPDGQHYAYNEASGNPEVDRIHVVSLATGADRVIAQGDSKTGFEAFDYEVDGIYAGRPAQGPGTIAGLWRLDPQAGTPTGVDATHRWSWISHGYAYTVIPNPTDPVIVQGGPQADTLLRLDLGSHTVESWLHQRGVFLNVRGFDWAGRPVVLLGDTLADLAVVTGQNEIQPLAGGTHAVTFSYSYSSLVADPKGFWLGADQGVVRYSETAGFQLVWQNPTVTSVLPLVAGDCA